ncbi:hypothetical protein CEXT_750291 [Caerostris extrusa]|uniref:Uncharacterized protein n=1 Tax=Caerostris extrusa TaxID=172846 RepID=A0AAV4W4F7_CAEEX|nr:hypothetical protein CEXT_750291 [Caerostris extrusa]
MSFCATKSSKMSHFGVSPEDMIQMMRKTSHITRSQVFLINVTMIDAFPILTLGRTATSGKDAPMHTPFQEKSRLTPSLQSG